MPFASDRWPHKTQYIKCLIYVLVKKLKIKHAQHKPMETIAECGVEGEKWKEKKKIAKYEDHGHLKSLVNKYQNVKQVNKSNVVA